MPGYLRMFLDFYDLFEKHSMSRYFYDAVNVSTRFDDLYQITRLEVWYFYLWCITHTEQIMRGLEGNEEIVLIADSTTCSPFKGYLTPRELKESHTTTEDIANLRTFFKQLLDLIRRTIGGVQRWYAVGLNEEMTLVSDYIMLPYIMSIDASHDHVGHPWRLDRSDRIGRRDSVISLKQTKLKNYSDALGDSAINDLWLTGIEDENSWFVFPPPELEFRGFVGATNPNLILADLQGELEYPMTTYMFACFENEEEFITLFEENPRAFKAYVELLREVNFGKLLTPTFNFPLGALS